ncbi:hypothetical protein ES703_115872 [subsurface metagenome]
MLRMVSFITQINPQEIAYVSTLHLHLSLLFNFLNSSTLKAWSVFYFHFYFDAGRRQVKYLILDSKSSSSPLIKNNNTNND